MRFRVHFECKQDLSPRALGLPVDADIVAVVKAVDKRLLDAGFRARVNAQVLYPRSRHKEKRP